MQFLLNLGFYPYQFGLFLEQIQFLGPLLILKISEYRSRTISSRIHRYKVYNLYAFLPGHAPAMLLSCYEVSGACAFPWASSERLTVSARFWLMASLLVTSSKCFQVLLNLPGALTLAPPPPCLVCLFASFQGGENEVR